MSYKNPVNGLYPVERADIRYAVALAVAYWPNKHLGEYSRLEDIRRAFQYLRESMGVLSPHVATWALRNDALSCLPEYLNKSA